MLFMATFAEVMEIEYINERHPLVTGNNLTNTAHTITGKRCEMGCNLVLFTNRKSHTDISDLE